MRKIIFQVMLSLDGFFEGPKREIDWHNVDEEFNDYAINFLDSVDTLIFGRITYRLMADYWPTEDAMTNDPIVAEKMNALKKIVYSNTLQEATWNNTLLLNEFVLEEILALKEEPGLDMAIFGSSDLSLIFIENNLIDEFRFMINPVVLGKGKTLFEGLGQRLNLKLLEVITFASGNVFLRYERIDK